MTVSGIDVRLISTVADSVGESAEQFVKGAVEERCNSYFEKTAKEMTERILQRLMSQLSQHDYESLATAYLDGCDDDELLNHLK